MPVGKEPRVKRRVVQRPGTKREAASKATGSLEQR